MFANMPILTQFVLLLRKQSLIRLDFSIMQMNNQRSLHCPPVPGIEYTFSDTTLTK
ncbi:hypothetical protein BH10PLA2_BH10PLA2_35860 [soil metagenome]